MHESRPHLYVISHTHWDREWYLSHENFRLLLVDLIDHLIELMERDPAFKYFHLDGQTIVLEDYLEIRPAMRERLANLISGGRILIGPWYLQNDEFLTDGESTVRNLLLGIRICRREFGVEPMMIGYIPDQFGNISQMPQILRGFGIQSCVFGRGYMDETAPEFLWRASDGSDVFAVHLMHWYNNAQRLPRDTDTAIAMCRELLDMQQGRAQTAHRLLMNGVDHLEAQENLSAILADITAANPEFTTEHSTLPAYINVVRDALPSPKVHQGEMRDGGERSVLSGTASARVHLKQMNFRCQQELRRWVEPFAVFAGLSGSSYDARGPIDYAWKTLIQCHPHDSICGCSIDEVHFQMEARFRRVLDVLTDQLRRSFRHLAATIKAGNHHSAIVVFNAHPVSESWVIEATIDFLEVEKPAAYEIADADGNPVEFQALESRAVILRVLNPKRLPKLLKVRRFTILVNAQNVPALGYKCLHLTKSKQRSAARWRPAKARNTGVEIANEHLKVTFKANGTLDLTSLDSGQTFPGLHFFEDTGDKGNEYIYMPLKDDAPRSTHESVAKIEVLEASPLRQRVRVTYKLKLPPALDDRTESRSGRPVNYVITTLFSLSRASRFLEVETSITNNVKDHRLRVLFPTKLSTDQCISDCPFDIVRRPFETGTENRNNQHPMESFSALSDGTRGLGVFSTGIPEHEVMKNDSTMALTLLRCVDILGDLPPEYWAKDQMIDDYTPEAQCQRDYTFRYALFPFAGKAEDVNLRLECDRFLHPPRTFQLPLDRNAWVGTRPGAPKFFDYFQDEHSLIPEPPAVEPTEKSFISLDNPQVALCAVKFPEHGDVPDSGEQTAVVRLVNYAVTAQRVTLKCGYTIARAENWMLGEEPTGLLPVQDNSVAVELGPKSIRTVGLFLKASM